MTMTLTAQAPNTPELSLPTSPQAGDSTTATGDLPAASLSQSVSPVEATTGSPQPAPLAIITASPLIITLLALVILNNILSLLILLRKPGKRYLKNLIRSKSGNPIQDPGPLEMIQNQMKKQQNLLQSVQQNQQALLRKTDDMERSMKRIGHSQSASTAPLPRPGEVDKPLSTPRLRLDPADHLVQVLEQGGDRAALAQWSVVRVKVTAASQDRTYRGDMAGVELEPAQAGASFLVFQVNGENLLVPNQETLEVFQRYQRGHTGLFVLKRQPSRSTPQVSKPARVQRQGRLWRVVEQGEVLI